MDVIKGKGKELSESEKEQERQHKAAAIIQRAYRHHSSKRRHLTSEARWKDTLTGTRKQVENKAAEEGRNTPMARWERGVFLAGRLQDGDAFMSDDEDENGQGSSKSRKRNRDPEHLKALDTQHWLELVDPKHRYGSNRQSILLFAAT
ncbi:hypothetical protein CPB86DRAFT_712343 [Serendipita vermifera]|nr:hypothetical protein CPB86DRAFT_712343 [Serendipita vermifera]